MVHVELLPRGGYFGKWELTEKRKSRVTMGDVGEYDLGGLAWDDVDEYLGGEPKESSGPELEPEVQKFFENIRTSSTSENEQPVERDGMNTVQDMLESFLDDDDSAERVEVEAEETFPDQEAVMQEAPRYSSSVSSKDVTGFVPRMDLLAEVNASAGLNPYTGLSAVEAARRKAQDMAMESLGDKRRHSSEDEDRPLKRGRSAADESPEKTHQKRYQRRLQKNRDTAYISRIRRRAYTTLLEESLTAVESEKKQLSSKVDTLKSEICSLQAELRGLYASTLSSPFAGANIRNRGPPVVNDSDLSENSSVMETKPILNFFQGIFKPIGDAPAPNLPFNSVPNGSVSRRNSRNGTNSASKGSVMLMFSLLFIIAIPGLCYGPTLSEVATFAAVPVETDDSATVWRDISTETPSDGSPVLESSDIGELPLEEKCKLACYSNSIECLQNNFDIDRVGFGGGIHDGGIIAH